MISKLLPGLFVLIPFVALASSGEESPGESASLKAWSIEALCAARERDDVRAELKRRDIFSGRELRAIRQGDVNAGISLEALTCIKGPPSTIVDSAARVHARPVAAYIHLTDGSAGSLSYVFEDSAGATVIFFVESENPAAIVRDPANGLRCDGPGRPTRCRLISEVDVFWRRVDSEQAGVYCGDRLCGTDVPPPKELPLPRVPDDAR